VIGSLSLTKYDIDLTQGGMFTVSKGSKEILSGMEEPVTLQFFYSNSVSNGIPILKSYAARIRGLLEDYEKYSNGHIKLKIIDPKPFSNEEDLAVSYGIKGLAIDQMGTNAYLGLVASNSVDAIKSIPFFALEREKYLEYEITRMIYDLNNLQRKKVGFISSVEMGSGPMMGIKALGGGSDWLIVEQIKQMFDVVDLGASTVNIPADIDVLMVVQPKDFSSETLYAIDQFVMKGGKLIMFADPNKEVGGTGNPDDRSFSANANKLFESWGIKIDNHSVVADRVAARKFDKGGDPRETWNIVNYLPWLNLREKNVNKEELITSLLKSININSSGFIDITGGAGIDIVPLIQSNEEAMIIPVTKIRPSKDPEDLLRNFVSDNKKYTLAAKISGKLQTAFPENSSRAGHLSSANAEANIVILADVDILFDENWSAMLDYNGQKIANITADNASFVMNCLDQLSGDSQLVSIRGGGALNRPFTVVENLRRVAEERFVKKQEELTKKLAETEKKLSDLQKLAQVDAEKSLMYKKEQQIEIRNFTDEMEKIKKDSRILKGDLRENIESLGSVIKFINIWLIPIIISCFAIFIFMIKSSGTKRLYQK
jgi:ABC-type uncharacterized transport system involved in gliding motility auxiliary subunit